MNVVKPKNYVIIWLRFHFLVQVNKAKYHHHLPTWLKWNSEINPSTPNIFIILFTLAARMSTWTQRMENQHTHIMYRTKTCQSKKIPSSLIFFVRCVITIHNLCHSHVISFRWTSVLTFYCNFLSSLFFWWKWKYTKISNLLLHANSINFSLSIHYAKL